MGDLLRYKELYSVKEKKDYRESLKHYERAALLMPDIGNAHNQVRLGFLAKQLLEAVIYVNYLFVTFFNTASCDCYI